MLGALLLNAGCLALSLVSTSLQKFARPNALFSPARCVKNSQDTLEKVCLDIGALSSSSSMCRFSCKKIRATGSNKKGLLDYCDINFLAAAEGPAAYYSRGPCPSVAFDILELLNSRATSRCYEKKQQHRERLAKTLISLSRCCCFYHNNY